MCTHLTRSRLAPVILMHSSPTFTVYLYSSIAAPCDWSKHVTWPQYCLVIGQYRSRDHNTGLWLDVTSRSGAMRVLRLESPVSMELSSWGLARASSRGIGDWLRRIVSSISSLACGQEKIRYYDQSQSQSYECQPGQYCHIQAQWSALASPWRREQPWIITRISKNVTFHFIMHF